MSDISLSKAVRSNLLSLQNTATMMSKTQDRLATGNKVNSALDNPTNYFTASALNSRAGDINQLLDGMNNGIQTLQAADNGMKAITKTLESMQSTLRQARQDKSFQTKSFAIDTSIDTTAQSTIDLKGGSIGETAISIDLIENVGATAAPAEAAKIEGGAFTAFATGESAKFTVSDGANSHEVELTAAQGASAAAAIAAIQQQLNDNGVEVDVSGDATGIDFTSRAKGADAAVAISGITAPATTGALGFTATSETGTAAVEGPRAKNVEELVNAINTQASGMVRASNDNGKLRIENLSTTDLEIDGISSTGVVDGTSTEQATIDGNSVRSDLATQFRDLRDQLDKLADDASFNGINLLRGDNLQITFNETATSELNIRSKDEQGISSSILGLNTNLQASDLDSDANIDKLIAGVKSAINDVRSQSSAFGSSLSVVQNRQDFSKNMINTLQTGAANLTLADMNEEAANLLALQTRQSLSSSALSMASQADQSVLQLLR